MTRVWVSNHLLSWGAVVLGQLVGSVESPSQNSHTPLCSPLLADDHVQLQIEDFHDTLEHTKGSAFNLFLTQVFSAAFDKSTDTTTTVDAAVCKTYQLKNSDEYFSKICRSNGAREWLERSTKRRRDVFLVVGLRTVVDAQVTHMNSVSRNFSDCLDGSVARAITLALTAGALPPSHGTPNATVGLSRRNQYKTAGGFSAPGEQIYAVQYRKIEFSWFSGRNLDKASLEDGNRWKVYVGKRGSGGERQDDIICARLQGGPPTFNLEGECESFTFGDSEEEMICILK